MTGTQEQGNVKQGTHAHLCSFIKGYSVRPFAGYSVRPFAGYSVRPFAFLKSNFALHLFCENK